MPTDVRQEGVQNLAYARTTHRGLIERALQMRAVSYLAQRKAVLFMQTIFEVDRSKDELRTHSLSLEKDREIIQRQKAELEARTAALIAPPCTNNGRTLQLCILCFVRRRDNGCSSSVPAARC